MRNVKGAFSEILLATLLMLGCIGLLWSNEGTSVNAVKAVKYYNTSHYFERN